MMRYLVLMLLVLGWSAGCAKYSTHMGRVGKVQPPAPLADAPPIHAVTYGSAPVNQVPELVEPITRTVWIKGYQPRPGEYVGAYPLTLVYTRADFVREVAPHPTIPKAIEIDAEDANRSSAPAVKPGAPPPRPSVVPMQGQTGPTPVPHLGDLMDALGHPAGTQYSSSVPAVKPDTSPPRPSAGPPLDQALRHQPRQHTPQDIMEILDMIQDAQPEPAP